MWNLQTHSEKEDSAWLSHVCMLFSDLPTRKRPPFGGIRNPTSEPQWRFFLFGMSVHVIFCLNWWNLKGKDSVCKICFNFFFQPTNQSTTASCSAKMFFFFSSRLWWIERCFAWSLLRSLVLQSFGIVSGPCTTCLGFELFSTAKSLSTLRCLRCWIFKKILVGPFSSIFNHRNSKMRKYWQFISKDKWSSKVFWFSF